MHDTHRVTAELRASESVIPPDIDHKLARFEAAIAHALASSPDGETIAQPEELVSLDALCDLHVALRDQPEVLRARLRPIVDDWIAHAAMTGITPEDLAGREPVPSDTALEAWLNAGD
jgi:hypothetical protein